MVDLNLKSRVEAYYRAFNARDEKAYLACFHPEGAVGGTLTGAPIPGLGVQKAILRTASGSMGDLTMGAVNLYQAQQEVVVEWEGDVKAPTGDRNPVRGISLFVFDEEDRIRLSRVFWNPRALTGQGPDDFNAVDSAHQEVIASYFELFNARDWDGIGRLFAEGGSFGGTLAGPGLRGGTSLRGVYDSAINRFPGIRMVPIKAYQAQNDVAVRWEGEAQSWDGGARAIQGVSLFSFDGSGRIARYRIYWDPRPLLQQA